MATWRQALEVVMTEEEVTRLLSVSRSRTEPASWAQRARCKYRMWSLAMAFRETITNS
jgi:hypothetical protein